MWLTTNSLILFSFSWVIKTTRLSSIKRINITRGDVSRFGRRHFGKIHFYTGDNQSYCMFEIIFDSVKNQICIYLLPNLYNFSKKTSLCRQIMKYICWCLKYKINSYHWIKLHKRINRINLITFLLKIGPEVTLFCLYLFLRPTTSFFSRTIKS